MNTSPLPHDGPAPATGEAHVLVLSGGLSHERDVSIKSGRRVAQVLRSAGFEVTLGDVDTNLLPFVQQTQPDVVWPLLHGSTGEDGSLTDLLSLTGVPFIGSEATGARVSWSKPIAKAVVARAGGTTPRLTTFTQALFRDVGAPGILELVSSHFTFPLVVKPASGGSALGVSVVDAPEHLPHAMVSAFAYDDVVMVEEFVDGIEVAVSVVDFGSGPLALPAVEIDTDGAYDYDARYNAGRSEYFVPARLDETQLKSAERLAILAHEELGLRHYSRSDMRITADGAAHFLEVNTAPGMTETSLFPQAAEASSYGIQRVYRSLVDVAMKL
ncbi:MAG TPA: D-alanine--D-alanine ligase [Beutenbergiaceae bacterium]|nr:D-alanine--D-alanine ligase [Beutenbergiaceae bacterium]